MAQSCVNIFNEAVLDLEKKIESICKGASSFFRLFKGDNFGKILVKITLSFF